MSVTKRVRYEVLRRDNHTCRYCGAAAPAAVLTVDHVTPVSLGGSDNPDNLVAACRDCNAGKSSSSPDAPLVADVAQDAVRWSAAIRSAALDMLEQRDNLMVLTDDFLTSWQRWTVGDQHLPLPAGWRNSVAQWIAAGLPMEILCDGIDVAMGRDKVAAAEKFTYVAGIAWSRVRELQDAAKATVSAPAVPDECPNCGGEPWDCMRFDADGDCLLCGNDKTADHYECCSDIQRFQAGYDAGFKRGLATGLHGFDVVASHIDGGGRLLIGVMDHLGITYDRDAVWQVAR